MKSNEVQLKPSPETLKKMGVNNITVKNIVISPRNKLIKFTCEIPDSKYLSEIDNIYTCFHEEFGSELDIKFDTNILEQSLSKDIVVSFVEKAIDRLKIRNATSRSFLSIYKIKISGEIIKIELKDTNSISILMSLKINAKIEVLLFEYGIKNYRVEFISGDLTKEFLEIEKKMDDDIDKKINEIANNTNVSNEANSEKKAFKTPNSFPYKAGNKTKEIKAKSVDLEALEEAFEGEVYTVEGEIFSIETRDLRNDKILKVIRITNDKTSITTKVFLEKKDVLEISEGDYVKINGKVQVDTYSKNEKIIMINAINKLDKIKVDKIDSSKDKMVELHTHSKMSEMVGVADVSDIIERAHQYGHKSIAITDYSVVHSFPFAYSVAKSKGMSIILGCEMNMLDDSKLMVKNGKEVDIKEETYVVFDLETMGLNSHKNEIIEIGAVKLKGTNIIEEFSELVNPNKKIPEKIKELTKIDDSMLIGKEGIEKILAKFLDFVGDATLVAHNANFDMGFIIRDIKKYLNMNYRPTVIDTLQMARDLYPNLKSFGLKNMNKVLGLSLDSHHRAIDDAKATARMFKIFLENYIEKGAEKLNDLNTLVPLNTKKQDIRNIVVLVKSQEGLKNLYRLVSESHIDYFGSKKARILKSEIEKYREGLIIGASLSAHFMNESELTEAYLRYDFDKIEKNISFYDYIEFLPKSAYNELYEEEETGPFSSEKDVEEMNEYFYGLAKSKNIPVTASSNVHYLDKEDAKIRSILLFGSGSVYRRNQYQTDNGFYFRTTDELLEEFSYLGEDVAKEIVIENTNKIATETEMLKPVPDGFYPPEIENASETVREMSYNKAYEIYGNPLPEIVKERLERELKAIIGNGFSVLYLSAQKLVKKSLDNGYLVGSRGSVGSSIVAFMMDITEVNALYPHYICENPECKHSEFIEREGVGIDLPEKDCPCCGKKYKRDGYAIPFEVFMGFKGDKVPDIDLNFSGEYQAEIHRYCEELFGKENVFKAGTISTLAEKNAIGYVRKYVEDNNINTNDTEIIRLAKKCEGAKKTTGQHPGGMIVVPKNHSIYEFCPVQKPANDEKNDSITTHFDYHVMDEQLVKLDILGHDDPTTIRMLQEYTKINVYDIPLSDPETLKIFSSTDSLGIKPEDINSEIGTFGVPEFGTPFVRQMLMDTKPTTFAELVRISGLSHGTDVWLNNAQDFVRSGQATLSEIITVRDDIMNYLIDQGIEKDVAFKIMEFVRKGRPSKEKEAWDNYSNIMKEKNVKEWYIESCRRIKYMFPKGHAVAYVMMAVRIAYFKVHHPLAFYAAYLSRKADDFDWEVMGSLKLAISRIDELSKEPKLDVKKKAEQALCEIIMEMNARKIELLPIDLYKSDGYKFILEDGKIRTPLIGISGLGASVIDNIIRERALDDFISLEDLKRRTKISQTVIEKLKAIGAIKNLNETNQISLF